MDNVSAAVAGDSGHASYVLDPVTQAVWERVTQRRGQLRWTGEELARRVSAQGVHFPRSVVTNLDNHRRSTLSVHELVALATALGVSTLWLLSGVGRDQPKCTHCDDRPPAGYTCNRCGLWTARDPACDPAWQAAYLAAQEPEQHG